MMKKILSLLTTLGMLAAAYGTALPVRAQTTVDMDDLDSGDLIRGETFSAVYYFGADGFRYTFPNDKTYFTWYDDFDDVKWLSDADLGKIQIGGNVTYKPGVKMIKINSDPKTYAVDAAGTIRWVTNEEVAIDMYGSAWNTMIDDVPDGFFPNYTRGDDVENEDDFDPSAVEASVDDINEDKDLQAPVVVTISDNTYSDTTVSVEVGQAVRFENEGDSKHTATAADLSWGSGTMNGDDTFSRYFDEPGEYDFFCSYHSSMTGTVIVE
jgi:plastocyanin